MPTDFSFPTNFELQAIAQTLLPALMENRPIFQILPIENADAAILAWEQLDNFVGLQQLRGVDGLPPRVKKTGLKRYMAEPGFFGEFEPIDEQELMFRRQFGTINMPVNINDLVLPAQNKLLQRELDRIEQIGWTLLSTGTFSVSTPTGVLFTDSYTPQTFTATHSWSDTVNSTPLADMRAAKLLHRGLSVNFGRGATAYAQSNVVNRLLSNMNPADVYGRRTQGFGTINSLGQIEGLFLEDQLATLVEYDDGYLDDSGTFQNYIPDNTVVLIGVRPAGERIGEYRKVRNVNNPGMAPGSYQMVVNRLDDGPPLKLEIHRGHNGGPVIFYPSAIVILHV